jgi:hypothetical protein
MNIIRKLVILTLIVCFVISCKSKISISSLEEIKAIISNFPEKELCIQENHDNSKLSDVLIKMLQDIDYDCVIYRLNDKETNEDSVIILTKNKFLERQVLTYDFAKRERVLKTWNYPKASDKREQIDSKLYLQTSSFD